MRSYISSSVNPSCINFAVVLISKNKNCSLVKEPEVTYGLFEFFPLFNTIYFTL